MAKTATPDLKAQGGIYDQEVYERAGVRVEDHAPVPWSEAEALILLGRAKELTQYGRSKNILIVLQGGRKIKTIEPKVGAAIVAAQRSGKYGQDFQTKVVEESQRQDGQA